MDAVNPNPPPSAPPPSSSPADEPGAVSRSFSVSHLLGVLFLLSQAVFIVQSHFSADSPRLLTPVEGLTRYEVHATFAQRPLTESEIRRRYGIPDHDDSLLSVAAVRAAVAHREKPIPLSRALYVRLRTRGADGTEAYWLWPQE